MCGNTKTGHWMVTCLVCRLLVWFVCVCVIFLWMNFHFWIAELVLQFESAIQWMLCYKRTFGQCLGDKSGKLLDVKLWKVFRHVYSFNYPLSDPLVTNITGPTGPNWALTPLAMFSRKPLASVHNSLELGKATHTSSTKPVNVSRVTMAVSDK